MDVHQNNPRERVFSILNDNSCPSFVIRQKQTSPSPPPTKLPSISSFSARLERPNFLRQAQYQRTSSVSSLGSPPLLRYDSTSSKSSSSSSMDSTPSPVTPAYTFNDVATLPYDGLRPDLGVAYLPSPTTITPFMEQQMLISAPANQQLPVFEPKSLSHLPATAPVYPAIQMQPAESQQRLPTPSLSNHASVSSSSSAQSKASPPATNGALPTGKKNKYPCPYAVSHNCVATFTTSGHAARHGKKHTGEKGVHCPICNKAFTRKDNMKQHERTHKNAANKNSDETRSKAAITKEAQKAKSHKKTDSENSVHIRRNSLIQSPLSEAPTLAPNTVDTPINIPEANFYQDPSPPLLLAPDSLLGSDMAIPPSSMYPPLGDETLLGNSMSMKPSLIRGFSDLDTLAQAAEFTDGYAQYPH